MDYQLTIVCIVNNQQVFDDFKVNLSKQVDVFYQLLPLYNLDNSFSGARDAYNSCIDKIIGEYVVYIHPDIRFLHDNSLKKIYDYCLKIKEFGVIGIAGCSEKLRNDKRVIYSSIFHGENQVKAGEDIVEQCEVQTVDECLFVMQRELIKNIKFESKKGWHLYAVEQCLRCQRRGLKNYVIPADVWHLSDGKSLNPDYVLQLKELFVEFPEYQNINTTVRKWSNKRAKDRLFLFYYYYKQKIKRFFLR